MTYSIVSKKSIPYPVSRIPLVPGLVAKRFLDFLQHYVVYHAMLRMLKKLIAKGSAILHPHSFHLYGVHYSPPFERRHDGSGFEKKKSNRKTNRKTKIPRKRSFYERGVIDRYPRDANPLTLSCLMPLWVLS